jgi:hypothetical protein
VQHGHALKTHHDHLLPLLLLLLLLLSQDDGPMPQNFSGTSSLTVPLNGPPYCSSSSGECLTIDRSIATTPDAHFKACAVAWADPEKNPITYDFGTLSALREQKAVATNVPGSCFTFASLPPGPSTLYACAVDSMGARTCQEVSSCRVR